MRCWEVRGGARHYAAGLMVVVGLGLGGCSSDGMRGLQRLLRDEPPPAAVLTTEPAPAEVPRLRVNPEPQPAAPVQGGLFPPTPAAPAWVDPGPAAPQPGDVTLNFAGADLREAIRFILGDLLGRSHVLHPDLAGSITLHTTRPIPRQALLPLLENVLSMQGAALVEHDGILEVVPRPAAFGVAPVGGGIGYGIEVMPLRHIDSEQAMSIIESVVGDDVRVFSEAGRHVLVIAGPAAARGRLSSLISALDVDLLSRMTVALVPLQHAKAAEAAQEMQALLGQRSTLSIVPVARMNAVLIGGVELAAVAQAKAWIERLDQKREDGVRRLYVYHVEHGRAADLASILGQIFGSASATTAPELAPGLEAALIDDDSESGFRGGPGQRQPPRSGIAAGGGLSANTGSGLSGIAGGVSAETTGGGDTSGGKAPRVIADKANNSLLIMATPEEHQVIRDALRQLDVEPLQVLVEATIAEITLRDDLRFGIEWYLRSGRSELGTAPGLTDLVPPASGFSFLYTGVKPQVLLNALAGITNLKVISAPQVVVLDNRIAKLSVGNQVPVITQQRTDAALEDHDRLTNTIEYRETGVILAVQPRVNANGLVTMTISQEVSSVDRSPGIDTGDLTPTIRQRKVSTTVAVHNGETVVLGGFISDSQERGDRGIPGLMDVPLFGNLFKTQTDNQERTELIVLITPRTIGDVAQARRVTEDLRRRLHSLESLQERIR